MLCCEVYYGAATVLNCHEPGLENLSKSETVVVALLAKASLLDKGYMVTLDNWYTSLRLVEYLWKRRTAVRGTVRVSRGIPSQLKEKKLQNLEVAYMRKNQVLAGKLSDKKDVYLLTTADDAGEVEVERVLRGNKRMIFKKPTAVQQYNSEMGGVDLTDQYLSGIHAVRKSQVWFKKLVSIIFRDCY